MKSEILKALVSALGGEGEELYKEFDKFSNEYPNLTLIMTDVLRNAAHLAQDVSDLNNKIEILKDLLLQAGVIKSVRIKDGDENIDVDMLSTTEVPEAVEDSPTININEILWHHMSDDGDLPN